jgi:hypothetical protein
VLHFCYLSYLTAITNSKPITAISGKTQVSYSCARHQWRGLNQRTLPMSTPQSANASQNTTTMAIPESDEDLEEIPKGLSALEEVSRTMSEHWPFYRLLQMLKEY